ncbi:ATP-binding cassette domain-containing protein [Pseudooceanicola sp. CBS1P-1]|uniref:ATP-binding cassette domain-containing protein n=1 Tax=Pseudooceanicola albus TaxID=2692189 RepID=A0A6L7G8H1_9RHOB|nr:MULTISPECIES: ATP-binding cassette domain-containing protein [Pseudooceanicola]MBT9384320.1 ATP-binding cassette domain-containing protein [Pseudooceanicola endophyticus]MXN19942.1 ATP-binding cassette domain-containing protein [Pseudooceanicola albus]
MTQTPVIRLSGIRKTFGRTVALNGVDLSIRPGEVHAVVGENGAGKSTLINVAAGVLRASAGTIEVDGTPVPDPDPVTMRRLGLSVAYQHPALPAHLTVLECLALVNPDYGRPGGAERARALIERVAAPGLRMAPTARVADLSLGQKHVAEIVRALASNPRVLVLDEPTEPFKDEDVRALFEVIRSLRAEGLAIVYISHRLNEVAQIADTLSVLRDGQMITTRPAAELSHDEVVALIVGQSLGQVFPSKTPADADAAPLFEVSGLSGPGFRDVSLQIRPGEILGLAGVEGQGQREVMRALAGLEQARSGRIAIAGVPVDCASRDSAQKAGIGFVPDDRHSEGLFLSLSVQENLGLGNMDALAPGGLVAGPAEARLADRAIRDFSIKTPGRGTPVSALSGGNQQKVLIAREVLAAPRVLLIDEPTKGVDIGSKSEVYFHLRRLAAEGIAVLVASSDGVELEGLCDRVLVFSRGQISAELSGDQVNDEAITAANLQSTSRREGRAEARRGPSLRARIAGHDHFPVLVLTVLAAAISVWASSANGNFLSAYNIGIFLSFLSVLAFISFAQLAVMLVGEIDFSLGPMAGLVVVVASFWLPDGNGAGALGLGAVGILALTTLIGAVQGLLIIWLRLPSIVVTLASFFGLQGVSLLLRPLPDGAIAFDLSTFFTSKLVLLPVAAALALLACLGFEWMTFRSRTGRALRAIGSDGASAFRLGLRRTVTVPAVFALAGLLTGIGGLILAGEVGFGSPTTGINYSLMSITAVVLGGAIISGGRGSFLATLFGAILVQVNASATSFLQLGTEWQYLLVGLSTLLGAGFYALARRRPA